MGKKLTEEQQKQILEAGIEAFAEHGLHGANMAAIARSAQISVGVLYKYYSQQWKISSMPASPQSLRIWKKFWQPSPGPENQALHYASSIIHTWGVLQGAPQSHSHVSIRSPSSVGSKHGNWRGKSKQSLPGSTPPTLPGPGPG